MLNNTTTTSIVFLFFRLLIIASLIFSLVNYFLCFGINQTYRSRNTRVNNIWLRMIHLSFSYSTIFSIICLMIILRLIMIIFEETHIRAFTQYFFLIILFIPSTYPHFYKFWLQNNSIGFFFNDLIISPILFFNL